MDTGDSAAPPPPAKAGRRWWRARPALLVAFFASIAVHLLVTLYPEEPAGEPDSIPLTATLSEVPPPPVAAPAPPPPPARKRDARPPAPRASIPVPAPDAALPAEPPGASDAPQAPSTQPANEPAAEAQSDTEPPSVVADEDADDEAPAAAKVLPPRVDLAYKVFYGTQGFWIGSATYRFEHSESRYRIATVGEARGLAALLFRGQGRMESKGAITGSGLRPREFVVDKFNHRGAERAEFDWDAGLATLHGDKTAPLEDPTFDILTLMWQYYFSPPEGDRHTFALATTRRIMTATVAREGTETIRWRHGDVEAEVWRRTSADGSTDAWVWLAPSLRWLPVKLRVTNTRRGTIEALLDQIRVDESEEGAAAAAQSVESDEPIVDTMTVEDDGPPPSQQHPSPLEYDHKP